MSQQTGAESNYSGGAVGLTVFASIMLLLGGVFQAIAGIVALVDDEFYVIAEEWIFQFDTTTWGWIHLILGVILVVAGVLLFSGSIFARTVGVIVAVISAIVAFAWLPWYPLWGILIITLDVFVIWALTAHGRDITEAR